MKQLINFILISSFWLSTLVSAELYKYTNSEGVTVYTDTQPYADAETLNLKPLQTAKAVKPSKAPRKKIAEQYFGEDKVTVYQRFNVTSPINGKTIRNNPGNIDIKLYIKPKLNTQIGDRIFYYLDGKLIKKASKLSHLSINNIERGEHRIKAVIKNKQGKKLISTSTIKFNLLRFSILHRR